MLAQIVKQLGWFILLLLLQVLVFNHIHIAGYATPIVYLFFLLIFPSETSRIVLILSGFVAGFVFDTFSGTPGVGAATMTFMGFIRPALLRLFGPHEDDQEEYKPSRRVMGGGKYFMYLLTASLLHSVIFFTLEAFSFFNITTLLINIGGSTVLSTLVMLAIESIRNTVKRNRK